jgi:putative tryptophan/tyrosine transport system substrate-binding protein
MSQVRRRHFLIAAVGLAALSLPAVAQQEKRVRRIGVFGAGSLKSTASWLAAFRQGMAELRWVEGRDYVIEERYANGVAQAVPALAAELVALQPDLLLSPGDASARPLAQRTKTIPIVFAVAIDPVGNGLAASLPRPGGNATGLTSLGRDLAAKRLQLLKEAIPRVANVVLLFEPAEPGSAADVKEIEEAAARLGMRVTAIGLAKAEDIEPALRRGVALGAQAYIAAQGFLILSQRQAIADRLLRAKIPGMFPGDQFTEAGGLMSYSASFTDNFRRAATYVDKILKGAKPGDLPIEQPSKYELALNLKTAKAMGITFSQAFLVRADRVIE